jgi:diacylglycerol kinase (CTP)
MFDQTKTQGDLHLSRKIFHVTSILAILMFMILMPERLCWIIYFTVGMPLVLMDYCRRHFPAFNRFSLKIIGGVIRKHEIRQLSGSSYTIISVGLVFYLFPKPVSLLAVLFLAIGDPLASFFGLLYGKRKIFGKKKCSGNHGRFDFLYFGSHGFH